MHAASTSRQIGLMETTSWCTDALRKSKSLCRKDRSSCRRDHGGLGRRWTENKAWENFQKDLQLSDRTLEDGDLRGGIAGRFQFVANLILQVG